MYTFGSVTYIKFGHFFSGKELWLGYRRVDGVWGWADGSTVDYTNFGGPEKNKDCASWNHDGTWQYVDCTNENRPFCIWQPGMDNGANIDREQSYLETVDDDVKEARKHYVYSLTHTRMQ